MTVTTAMIGYGFELEVGEETVLSVVFEVVEGICNVETSNETYTWLQLVQFVKMLIVSSLTK
jgi:hypothetical protein